MVKKLISDRIVLLLLVVFVLSTVLKLWQFWQFPVGFHPDEEMYVSAAYSLFTTGTDPSGTWSPTSLLPFHPMFAELPVFFTAIGYLFSSNPLIAGRLVTMFMGCTLPLLFYALGRQLFKQKEFALILFIVASFNPWIWQETRFAFDVMYGIWFYLAGSVALLSKHPKLRLLAIPLFALGFFQYQGYKLLLVPLVFGLLLYQLLTTKPNMAQKLISLATAVALGGLFAWYVLIRLPSQGASDRISQQSILSDTYRQKLSQVVNDERRLAIPNKFQPLFSNKISAFGYSVMQKTFQALSPEQLFLTNEPAIADFTVWSHGSFYIVDLFLILLGVGYGLLHYRKQTLALLLFAVMALAPVIISETNNWYTFRPAFAYLTSLFFIAMGIQLIWKQQRWLKIGFIALYLISIVNFAYQYYQRYPIYSAGGFRVHYRVLSSFLKRQPADQPVVLLTTEPPAFVRYFVLFGHLTKDQLQSLQTADFYDRDEFVIGNLTVSDNCLEPSLFADTSKTIVVDDGISFCESSTDINNLPKLPKMHRSISSVLDSGEQIKIYNDRLCDGQQLGTFNAITSLDQFQVEQQSDALFCQTWIKDLSGF